MSTSVEVKINGNSRVVVSVPGTPTHKILSPGEFCTVSIYDVQWVKVQELDEAAYLASQHTAQER